MKDIKVNECIQHIQCGGFEQAVLEMVKQSQGLTPTEQERLDHLKAQPQNRVVIVRDGSEIRIK